MGWPCNANGWAATMTALWAVLGLGWAVTAVTTAVLGLGWAVTAVTTAVLGLGRATTTAPWAVLLPCDAAAVRSGRTPELLPLDVAAVSAGRVAFAVGGRCECEGTAVDCSAVGVTTVPRVGASAGGVATWHWVRARVRVRVRVKVKVRVRVRVRVIGDR